MFPLYFAKEPPAGFHRMGRVDAKGMDHPFTGGEKFVVCLDATVFWFNIHWYWDIT